MHRYWLVGLDLFNNDTRPSGHRIIPLLAGILLCKSREFFRRWYSMSRLHSIHHNIPVTLHTPGAYGQCWVFDHNGDKQSAVLGTRYGTLYVQFKVGWLQPLQLWLIAGISLEVPVSVSRDKDLYHVQQHPSKFEPTDECRSWPVSSNMYNGHLPMGLCLDQGSLLLVGPIFHFHQCQSGLVSSTNGYVCPCHSITRAGSWYDK